MTFQNFTPTFKIFCSLNARKPSGNKKNLVRLTKNSSKRQKHKTFFRSPHSFVWFGTLFTLRCLFLFDHPVDVNEGTISFRVRLVSPCCDRRKTSPRSRGERGGKIIYSFCAPKKESSFLLCCWCCRRRVISLLFYNYL